MEKTTRNPYIFETLSYLFWGGVSFGVNIGCFKLLMLIRLDYRLANFITLIVLKVFVFTTNKMFVFKTNSRNIKELILEFFRFLSSRIVTNCIDFFGLVLLAEVFAFDVFYSKIALNAIVIILNYFFSKLFVFVSR